MQDERDLPSTENNATPRPPKGENVKDLMTPGDPADEEAEAEQAASSEAAKASSGEAHPKPEEAPEEEQSPT